MLLNPAHTNVTRPLRTCAGTLRREIAAFIKANPDLEIAETPMRDWVKWDSGSSVSQYASKMAGNAQTHSLPYTLNANP